MMNKLYVFVTLVCLLIGFGVPVAQVKTDSVAIESALDEVVVKGIRLGNSAGQASAEMSQNDLQRQNTGVNLPYLLNGTPSLVTMSDDGLGVGYTYFRVRGTDAARINMTINGVPLNDSESQMVFWVNMTDMAASMGNVQVQRGVGTSTNGAAAFGASVNMSTEKSAIKPYAELSFNGGMYNTFKESAKFGTGLINNRFAFDGRFSKVNSDGYIYRAFSDLYSYYAAASYYGDNTLVKLMAFGGAEKTYMAWDGVSAENLQTDRRYNPAGEYIDDNGNVAYYDNQTDNYAQQHYQLHVAHRFNSHWNLNAGLHYTKGGGYYEQYKTDRKLADYALEPFEDANGNLVKKSDLVRQKHMDNHFYGGVIGANYTNDKVNVVVGGAANNYNGLHMGNVLWVRNFAYNLPLQHEYYRNRGDKFDANVYAKAEWNVYKGLSLYGDMQYRYVNYKLKGLNDEDRSEMDMNPEFHFFNPKAAIRYVNGGHSLNASFAIANREPNRTNYTESGENDAPTSERLFDYELSYAFAHKRVNVGANFYWMQYDNQLVLTGQYSETGAYITRNVKDSYRAGVELLVGVKITDWLFWSGNVTLSRNRIIDFTDWVDNADLDWAQSQESYGNTDIAFSPNILANSAFDVKYKGLGAVLQTNYVGKQYLDNTMNKESMLNQYCITNLNLSYEFNFNKAVKSLTLMAQLNNLFDTKYISNGGAYRYIENGTAQYTPWYYPQAGFNCHFGFTVAF